jgi:hypothetical protein
VTFVVIALVVGGAALLWGSMQRTSLGAFQPAAAVPSQLLDSPQILDRIAEALPSVPSARLQERDGDVLLVSAGPSARCLSRGAGIFVRIRRTPAGVLLEGRAKVRLNTNAVAALTEFERQVRQAVQERQP